MGRPTNAEIAARKSPVTNEQLPQVGSLRTLANEPVSGRKFKVVIYGDQNDKGPVDISVNGYNIRVKRDEEVIIDEVYVEVLKNAVIETQVWNQDTNTSTLSRRMVYPFQATEVPAAA